MKSNNMEQFERQLNNLPKYKLTFKSKLITRFKLYRLMLGANYPIPALASPYLRYTALSAILLLAVLGPVFAYSSASVIPGSVLYPIKRSIEKIELSFANTPEKQVTLLAMFAEKRLKEAEYAASGDPGEASVPARIRAVEDARQDLDSAREIATGAYHFTASGTIAENIVEAEKTADVRISELARDVSLESDSDQIERIAMLFMRSNATSTQAVEGSDAENSNHLRRKPGDTSEQSERGGSFASSSDKRIPIDKDNKPGKNKESSAQNLNNHDRIEKKTSAIRRRVETLKVEVKALKASTSKIVVPGSASSVFIRIEEKLKKTEEAIEKGDPGTAAEYIEKSAALTNFTKLKLENIKASSSTEKIQLREDKDRPKREYKDGQSASEAKQLFERVFGGKK